MREAGECKDQCRWEKADWCNYFNEEAKENTQKGQGYWGAGEVDEEEEEEIH